jgi:ribosomal protein L37AE/L43A
MFYICFVITPDLQLYLLVGRYLSDHICHNLPNTNQNRERDMAKNQIQFQKGLSMAGFLSRYGSEDNCYQALFSFRWPNGFRCPKCGRPDHCVIGSRKVFQCNYCHTQSSLLAGTIFASTKLPLTVWFLAIYLIRLLSRICGYPLVWVGRQVHDKVLVLSHRTFENHRIVS